MKLSTFTVKNYRSIITANKIPLQDLTVLIGKNNEGKSNLLTALNLAMDILRRYAEERVVRRIRSRMSRYSNSYGEVSYDWDRDFPISQRNKRNKSSEFILEFLLTVDEIEAFHKKIGNHLNGSLPISIHIDNNHNTTIKVIKGGKGSKSLNEQSQKIAQYIAQNIEFNYIPAIRTENESMEIINRQINQELSVLEKNPNYQDAINKIDELRKPILAQLSTNIKDVLQEFLPNLNSVDINVQNDDSIYRRGVDFSVKIDDGTKTNLQNKGDGIKSLVTLSLLKNIHINQNAASIVAIEEPESHLHPEAISALRKTVFELSSKSQVLLSTHNPLFVNKVNIHSNIIINSGQAKQAESIREIRNILGVKVSDNLYDSDILLIVEGETDKVVLETILSAINQKIGRALKNNIISIMPIGGAKHLMTYINICKQLICNTFIFFDNDTAGKRAIEDAINNKMIEHNQYLLCSCQNMLKESELEDCIDKTVYQDMFLNEYGVDINQGSFNRNDKKWTDRVETLFTNNGKLWTNDIKNEIKHKVALLIKDSKNPNQTLDKERGSIMDQLINDLELILSDR